MMPAPHVIQLQQPRFSALREYLESKGFTFSQPAYTEFVAKHDGISCSLYTSGKLVIQGKNMSDFIEFQLEPEFLESFSFKYTDALHTKSTDIDYTPRIGVDESGKGDFFGPLCIAAVAVDSKEHIESLLSSGAKDSKLLNDKAIKQTSKTIKDSVPYEVIVIMPAKYNELYSSFKNLNKMLAWGHATAINKVYSSNPLCEFAISDKFASDHVLEGAMKKHNSSIKLIQKTKAESDIVVAAASILARDAFLNGLSLLEKKHAISLQKGASSIVKNNGKEIYRTKGKDVLNNVCKTHFKTYLEILDETNLR